jgi:hypothetical protein
MEAEKLVVFAIFVTKSHGIVWLYKATNSAVIHLTKQDMFNAMQLSGNKYLQLKL